MFEVKQNPVSEIIDNTLYCVEKGGSAIECIDLDSEHLNVLKLEYNIDNMFAYDNKLFAKSGIWFLKLCSEADGWIKMNDTVCVITSSIILIHARI